ncbi:MAG: hypothetical protein KDK99_08470, partial [Verrucomicrobiales bacterium]|nr:hypothetical protein [Verrucomicrobiales bacterium]
MAFPVSLDRPALRAAQWEKLRAILQRMQVHGGSAAERVAGVESLESFCRVVNPLSKADILADRQLHPPFGSYLLEPLEHYTRLCQTSGTSTGQPIAWIDTPESWEAMLKCWRRVYEAAELQPGKDR